MTRPVSPSVSPEEVARFSAQASEWWNPLGSFRALHELGPLRLRYVREQVEAQKLAKKGSRLPLAGLTLLDVGCGGGLMAEPLARLGAQVTGVDASPEAIETAKAHARENGLEIDYRIGTAEALAQAGEKFDVITGFEIVEHVADLRSFMTALASLLNPGGMILIATMNRTKRSFLLGVVMAEYVLGWVPAGTHDWDKFVKPSEMQEMWGNLGIQALDVTGVAYAPLQGRFQIVRGRAAVNYFMAGRKDSAR